MKRLLFLSRFALPVLALSILALGPTMIDADNGPNHRVRNLNFGVSGGNVNDITRRFCCSGTLGALLSAGTNQYILSNNHVMGLSGRAQAGQDISQPGLIDNNCQVNTVVADFTVAAPLNSNVDAAIAQLRTGMMNPAGTIEDIGAISTVVRNPAVGLAVQKSGRTTGHTMGTIGAINATISVRYPNSCGGGGGSVFTFTNQVVINSSTFSAGGDSGSLIVTNNSSCPQPVALLFAGSSSSTIGNPAGQVLSRLSTALGSALSFVGVTCGTSSLTLEGLSLRQGLSDETVAHVSAVKERRENNLLSRPGVIGVGVGASDDNASEAVIIVYVDMTSGFSPRLPRRIDGVRVKTVYTDAFVAY